MYDSVLTGN